ncbi:MAG: hypothetical protein EP298_07825 [Gammaproteobacteria bacterium]|nr:MAG: hypothetical protein EP298_07825 [Gammaproteobacteria bacterium]UTW43659.1 patatin-like phospholipase family protein [bacterium SCSIO 12844]
MSNYQFITFSGGGAKGAVYIGVYKALKQTKFFDNIQAASGSSAGAITAALTSTGMSSERLKKVNENINFEKLLGDKTNWYGIERDGKPLHQFLIKNFKVSIEDCLHHLFLKREKKLSDKYFINAYEQICKILSCDSEVSISNEEKENKVFQEIQTILDKNGDITFQDLAILNVLDPNNFKNLHITGVEKKNWKFSNF